jgi:hypothetical protein
MFRTVTTPLLLLSGLLSSGCTGTQAAGQQGSEKPVEQEQGMKPASGPSSTQAGQLASQKLASQLNIPATDTRIVRVEPHTWPDSSMGCGKPGTLAMQVITEGYVVVLFAQEQEYRVHVSGAQAMLCDKPVLTRKEPRRPVSARGLNEAVQQARADLAQRLGADVSQVSLLRTQSHRWPNNGLGCPRADETIVEAPVMGYRILLEYAARTYTYHTDMKHVRPCPAIEMD